MATVLVLVNVDVGMVEDNMDIYEIINELKPCEFKYNWDEKKTLGFIAQDLLKVFPDSEYTLVKQDENGYYHIDQIQLISLLCLCLQKLINERKQ